MKDLSNKLSIPCQYIPGDMFEVAKQIFPSLKKGDLLIGLGAGSINMLGKELIKLSKEVVNAGQ